MPLPALPGRSDSLPPLDHPDLLAPATLDCLRRHPGLGGRIAVIDIDPDLADTEALMAAYGIPPEGSGNCVVISGSRGGEERIAACVVGADTRADVNNLAKRRLDVRKASFHPMDRAVGESGMEYGGITPVGLPDGWRIFIDERLLAQEVVVIGSGLRRSKLLVTGSALADLPGAEIVEGLGIPIA